MKVRNKMLSALLAMGLSAGMIMPVTLTGCSGKSGKEETTVSSEKSTENEPDGKSTSDKNAKIRLQDDYYGYINADTLRSAEIDPRYGVSGSFVGCELVKEGQLDTVIGTITSSNENYAPGSNEQMIRDYYNQVKEFDSEKSTANDEVEEVVKEIFAISSYDELVDMTGKMILQYNVDPFFGFAIFDSIDDPNEYAIGFQGIPGILGISFEEIRDGEEGRVNVMNRAYDLLRSFGFSEEEAEKRAEELTMLAIDLSCNYKTQPFSMGSIKRYSDEEIKEYIDAAKIAKAMGFENPYGKWYVLNEDMFIKITGKYTDEDNLEACKTWLASAFINQCQGVLSEKHSDLNPEIQENTMSPDEYAKDAVKRDLQTQLGEVYAETFYTEETDKAVQEMCELIRDSYREVISNADWLSEDTRAGLLRKLENLQFITGLGIPRKIDPKDAELFGNDAWETRKNLIRHDWEMKIEKLSSPRPISGQTMSPQTVNACYWMDNVVRITIAIVNEPFFSPDADLATNLGGLGMVIGHEVGHAFDSQGINWDENGYYNPDWIPDSDRKALNERAQKCIDYYSGYTIMGVYHVDGERTLGENYADLGSMQVITNIAKTKEERERLFENYALIWQELESDIVGIAALQADEHSPAMIRVNAVLSSCEAFYETYDIKEGDGMYVAPENRVSRW